MNMDMSGYRQSTRTRNGKWLKCENSELQKNGYTKSVALSDAREGSGYFGHRYAVTRYETR